MQEYNKKTLEDLQAEEIAVDANVDRRNHLMIERLLNEMTGSGNVAHDTSQFTERGDDSPVIRLDKRLFELKAERILPKHKLLKLFDPSSVRHLVEHCVLLKVRDGQMLYKEGDSALTRAYILLVGKIALKGFMGAADKLGTIGYVEAGDTLGEEGLFEVTTVTRKESALSEGDSYVFEIIKDNFDKLREVLQRRGAAQPIDWFTLLNHLKKQWVSKRSWRLYKEQEMQHVKLF